MSRITPRRASTAALGALLAVILLAGCALVAATEASPSSVARQASITPLSQLGTLPDPHSILGQSTALLRSSAITPVQKNPTPTLPVTVASHDRGGDVSITVKSVKRILGLDGAGSIAGSVFGLGLGGGLVGRDVATTFPGAKKLPVVTSPDGRSINAEAVLALAPTVVITDGTVGPLDVVLQLREAGIPVVFVQNSSSFEGAQELARQVGAALGLPQAAEKLADRIGTEVREKIAEIAGVAPHDPAKRMRMVFLYLRGTSGIYYLFGEGSGADALIDGIGGIDVAADIHWTGMKPMTDEALIAANPDLILVMTDGLKSAGGVDGLISAKPAVGLTTAGKNKRFVDMADGDVLSFGPRSAAVLDALARAVYAPGK